jgi:hypothetical protein
MVVSLSCRAVLTVFVTGFRMKTGVHYFYFLLPVSMPWSYSCSSADLDKIFPFNLCLDKAACKMPNISTDSEIILLIFMEFGNES